MFEQKENHTLHGFCDVGCQESHAHLIAIVIMTYKANQSFSFMYYLFAYKINNVISGKLSGSPRRQD